MDHLLRPLSEAVMQLAPELRLCNGLLRTNQHLQHAVCTTEVVEMQYMHCMRQPVAL